MQETIADFSTVMMWLVLLLALVAVIVLGISACYLPRGRGRALCGVIVMTLIIVMAGIDVLLPSRSEPSWKRLLLPLVAPLLVIGLYRLSFPPFASAPAARRRRGHQLFLLLLMTGAFLVASTLALLDLFSP